MRALIWALWLPLSWGQETASQRPTPASERGGRKPIALAAAQDVLRPTHSKLKHRTTPANGNVWDIDRGLTILDHSPLFPDFAIQDMFGASNSLRESGSTVFGDEREAGFVHFVEWRTAKPVTIRSLNLFAGGDGPEYFYEREFDVFTLKAKSAGSSHFDKTLISYQPSHPYHFIDAESHLVLSTNISRITAQEFRAEFKQYTAGRSYDGPRILELAAFSRRVAPRQSSRHDTREVPPGESEMAQIAPGYVVKNVEISGRGEYRVGHEVMNLKQLEKVLAAAADSSVNLMIYIHADKAARMASVAALLERCRRHRITQIVLRLESDAP